MESFLWLCEFLTRFGLGASIPVCGTICFRFPRLCWVVVSLMSFLFPDFLFASSMCFDRCEMTDSMITHLSHAFSRVHLSCRVALTTPLHKALSSSTILRSFVASLIGTWVKKLFQYPMTILVFPLIPACTAYSASRWQKTASEAFAATLRMW